MDVQVCERVSKHVPLCVCVREWIVCVSVLAPHLHDRLHALPPVELAQIQVRDLGVPRLLPAKGDEDARRVLLHDVPEIERETKRETERERW